MWPKFKRSGARRLPNTSSFQSRGAAGVAVRPSGWAGQWVSTSLADSPDNLVIDLDDGQELVRGTARIFFADGSPGATCEVLLPKNQNAAKIEGVALYWMPSGQATMVSTDQIRSAHPEMKFPDRANLSLSLKGDELHVSWSTNIGTSGVGVANRSQADLPSALHADQFTWEEFKRFALEHTPGTFIFRGQPKPYRLRTAFHRTYRKDLIRYVAEDIPLAHRQLTARTKHVFDLHNPWDRGAFWNLLQHHGYPTPLLDWSYSPFVAAFFAYRRRSASSERGERVRIYAFNKQEWTRSFNQLDNVNFAQLHFSTLEALAIENPRAIPQQALSTLTNVDDVETYIQSRETERQAQFLHAIDLLADDRPHVMAELSLMGITAGSLFPGLDGACEELMGRMFHQQVAPLRLQ